MAGNKILIIAGVALIASVLFFKETIQVGSEAVMSDEKFEKFDSLFKKYAAVYGVPWRWLKAICIIESSNGEDRRVKIGLENPSDIEGSKSSDGKSWGLMQITLATARGLTGSSITAVDLNNPDLSVQLAAKLLKELINRFGIANREAVIRAYNGGPKYGAATLPYYAKFLAALQLVDKYHGEE